ncbi:MAG TPA: ATP-grasp domain-containing protein [Vicinamibacterales bacterium]|nr:ATP-grasp domain-containing protein [Vicinamibacterales bacterium]
MNLLVAGVSTRAMAASAARAGFAVTAIDAFADVDQHPSVQALSLGGGFTPDAAAERAQTIACDAVAYAANFENRPGAVNRLAAGRALLGNRADVLSRVRDPLLLARTLRAGGFAAPDVREHPPTPSDHRRWLVKRYASGGGHGVREWRAGEPIPPGAYLQEFIDGTPASIAFVAARGRAVPIGFSRQLIGDTAFGSTGFRYCGNILTARGEDDDALTASQDMAAAVTGAFELVGVNGIDLVVKDGIPYIVEVNPRWCASMELAERAYGVCVFGMHSGACRDGVLPDFDFAMARRAAIAIGKAVVFARRELVAGDLRGCFDDDDVHDIPQPGTRIGAGQPVCTVFAAADDAFACRAELVRRAARIYASLDAML